MYQYSIVLFIVFSLGYGTANGHHNDTCEQEEQVFRSCMKRFFDSKLATHPPLSNSSGPDEEVERCFSSSGCQKPLFQGQQFEADIDRTKSCKEQLRQKTQAVMTDCVQKKAPDHVFQAGDDWTGKEKDEQEKRIHYQRWALAKQTYDTTICPVASNGEKVRSCLRDLWKRPLVEEGEKWRGELCNAKQGCMKEATVEILCQEHMNITRSLQCECALERGQALKQEFYDCIGIAAPAKDDHHEHFWELHYCKDSCNE